MDQMKIAQVAKATAKLREKLEAEIYEKSLISFVRYVWPVVEPAIPFVEGWALEAIAEHLEAVTHGQIRRLLINVPPGFSKSLLTDVFWPAWEWGPQNRPWYRYVCASYSNHLTERDNMRCRNIVMSDRYQRLWGNRFRISNEQFTKVKFANDQTGWKLATSTGGIGVGERGDRFIIDDANNTMMMESEAVRANTNMWFTEVVPDRLNNPSESAIIVIQQRLHAEDVSGVALSRNMGYTHLMIPMRYDEGRHCVTVLGTNHVGEQIKWEDPRSEEGELAWPERFPDHVCDQMESDKGPYAWAGQYQQTPEPRGGAIIKREWWQVWEQKGYPPCDFILASLDSAYTEKEENDPSAMTFWGIFRDEYGNRRAILLYAWEERLAFHDLVQKVIYNCTRDNTPGPLEPRYKIDKLLIEAKASGISVAQEIRRIVGFDAKFGVELINPTRQGDKVARAHSIVHIFSEEMVYAPDKAWADKVIDQCARFPKDTHDDLVDSTTQALRYLRDTGFVLRKEEHDFDVNESLAYRKKLQPIYPV
jgi:predicted phage terminase large subunit-like protein